MKHIISASRREDIPAFGLDWFINCIKKGEVEYQNPYQPKSVVSLKPENVLLIVFWSKNFAPFIKQQIVFKKFRLFFHFTISGQGGNELEPLVPVYQKTLEQYKRLVNLYGANKVSWRFDPIVLNDKYSITYWTDQFLYLSREITKIGGSTCIFSFYDDYKRAKSRFNKEGISYPSHFAKNLNEKANEFKDSSHHQMINNFVAMAREYNLNLFNCCDGYHKDNKFLQDIEALQFIKKAGCVNGHYFNEIFKTDVFPLEKRPTRKNCGCTTSIDIGQYGRCKHGCLYCYAR